MKRKLIQQMRSEWRSNLWMTVELIIVGFVLWGVFTVFAGIEYLHKEPVSVDFTDIYYGNIGSIPKDANNRKAYEDSLHNEWTDLENLLSNLKSNPYVENIGTGNNAIPYNFNYSGVQLNARIGDSIQHYMGNRRVMDPDMVRTLRMKGINGESSEQLAQMLEEGKTLISTYDRSYYDNDPKQWVGHEAWVGADSAMIVEIGAMIEGIRRSDYEPVFNGVLVCYYKNWFPYEIAIRVKPGKGEEFMASLKGDDLEFGNVYASNIRSIEKRKDEAHLDIHNLLRNLTACAAFVMIAVFLGFLGSFWYRTQQRVPEIALRKVNGATNTDLFRRLVSEGLVLLGVASVIILGTAAVLIPQVDIAGSIGFEVPKILLWGMVAVTLGVLALMIVGGIWLPARKAMKINPAEALKDQ